MLGLPDQAVHQNKLTRTPADRFYRMLKHVRHVVQQSRVRGEIGVLTGNLLFTLQTSTAHLGVHTFLKSHQIRQAACFSLITQQNNRPIPRFPPKTQNPLKRHVKRRSMYLRSRLASTVNQPIRQTRVIAQMMQRDMQPIRQQRPAAQAVLNAELLGECADLRCGGGVGQDGEE